MKPMKRAAVRNIPSQVRRNTKNHYQFWQNAFWACCTAKIRR